MATGKRAELVGFSNFVRNNPLSDLFKVQKFHHVEFWCADATNTYKRFQVGLGMELVAKSDHSTGNTRFASYALESGDLRFIFTAPYSAKAAAAALSTSSAENGSSGYSVPFAGYSQQQAYNFVNSHGLAVRAVGLLVEDASQAYAASVRAGGVSVLPPEVLAEPGQGGSTVIAEVKLYGDVVLRYVSGDFQGPFLPGYAAVSPGQPLSFGLLRLDHAVGNTHSLIETVEYIMGATGFHEFAEFVAEDVGTVDSGLNSMVLANNNEMVLMPINEPTTGTKRKSQIQTYLEQNEGPGLQHLALLTTDIVSTLRKMRAAGVAGFEFMPRPSDQYYKELPARMGDALTPKLYQAVEELGILADKDDQGTLLQIFTRPVGDRPTLFLEIIERLNCTREAPPGMEQAGGCGGFGKGNFAELFKSIEDYERTLDIN